MTATATFKNPEQAEEFSKAWTRKTKEGTTISAVNEKGEVKVTLGNVNEYGREWISAYVKELNK